ncbi:MAG: NADH-ubiquinone oxidoreductase chain H [uncultured Gemmatimonadaceae bacterium]|uniref:NADH-quinone oxidoreductase subunit H n=1 Tax=uncultured Gemmatimonadaceae bacterium TaxID=246130 RepID=A0A6J4MCZ5_9BACT|nr:MAG: NADH-ubiquinone oxidoreductase chain H [uncultured Gemmatimonadaceae bacterium]
MKLIVAFTVYMVGVALLTLAERKVSAWIQDRIGPNRVGKGWLQPAADGVKNFMKEESAPAGVNKTLFTLAPMLAFAPALVTWAVIPFGAPWASPWGRIEMVLADLPVGFLFTLAISSLGVYGIVLAGWASNNKYSLLGGLRSSAQLISYEIALGMSTIPVLILAGNVTLNTIVRQQASSVWNVLSLTIAFFVFLVAALAETNRLPFDLPEAESELIAGYHTEYSAMKFSLFFIAEYANMVTQSALLATLFLGGWDIPFMTRDNAGEAVGGLWVLLSVLVFLAKTLFFLFFYMWLRWTLPRFRYDQLMSLGWKFMLPLALAYIVIVASAVLALDYLAVPRDWRFGLSMFAMNVVLVGIVFVILDRGRIISPASSQASTQEIGRLRARAGARGSLIGPAETRELLPSAATQVVGD